VESNPESGINGNGKFKRRVDILSTPQFEAVICYVFSFRNWEEVLFLLWNIADGALIQDDHHFGH
jgi:hypothetical protein